MNINLDRVWYCTKCGNKIQYIIPRRKGKERCVSHLKKLWCTYCKEERNAVETQMGTRYDKEDFELEKEYGNFDTDGNRIMPYGLFRDKLHKEGIL